MLTREEAEAKFLEEIGRIERVVAILCRRHGLRGDDADDFASWIMLRLVEDDYAIVRKFRGESALGTYLTVAVTMLFRDYRVHQWGRWRPSAEARRRGTLAMRLELLVHRDGLALRQAAEQLRAEGMTTLSDRALGALLGALPPREPLRPHMVDTEVLADAAGVACADELVERADAAARRGRVDAALDDALGQLPDEDRLLVRLRFWDGLSIADVARALALPQKPLYRRLERLMDQLRTRLGAAGLGAEQVRELLDDEALREAASEAAPARVADADIAGTRPSNGMVTKGDLPR